MTIAVDLGRKATKTNKLTTTDFLMKRITKIGEHFYNFIVPLTITDYNDRGLGPSLCSLFTRISLNIFTTYYT